MLPVVSPVAAEKPVVRKRTRSPSPAAAAAATEDLPRHRRSRRRSPSPAATQPFETEAAVADEATRDARTVFVTQLPPKFTDRQLHELLAVFGRVCSGRIVTDKATGKSKGIAYVEFATQEAAAAATAKSGIKVEEGFEICVAASASSAAHRANAIEHATNAARRSKSNAAAAAKLRVCNIHASIGEEGLRRVFACIGPVAAVHAETPDAGSGAVWKAVVEFATAEDARRAVAIVDGFALAATPISVTADGGGTAAAAAADGKIVGTDGGRLQRPLPGASSAAGSRGLPAFSASACIQLQNLYDVDSENEPHWEYDVADDVRAECAKFGRIMHLHVAKNKTGDVYVKFAEAAAAQAAMDAMSGRWFGMRQIACRYVPENLYDDLFFY